MKKKKKKAPPKRAARKLMPPCFLDEEDFALVEKLRSALWTRTKQEAFVQGLRWCLGRLEISPTAYRKYRRESDQAWSGGKLLSVRLAQEHEDQLDRFWELTHADSRTDAMRICIRMAADHFVKE